MNFLNLKYFLVLAEELNFTQSAERLHISQQSLSSHVSRLEKECGLQLISREPPLHLTEAGMEFARSARVMLKEKETLEKRLTGLLNHQQGTITIGIPFSRSAILMPQVLTRFYRDFPDIKIRLIEGSSSDILKYLTKGAVDLILGFQPEESERLESHRIYMESTKIIVPNQILSAMPNGEDLRRKNEPLLLKTFADCPFISLNEGALTGRVLRAITQDEDFIPNIVVETKNLLTMLSLCCTGLGVCICPNSYLMIADSPFSSFILDRTTVFDLDSAFGDSWIAVTWAKNKYQSAAEKHLLKIIKETYPHR